MKKRLLRFTIALFSALSAGAPAEVRLPALLQDGVVFQSGMPIHLWGMADPNEAITAEFRGASMSTKADSLGRWSIYLKPSEAGGPYQVKISGTNTVLIKDVLVGEVWLASGQSNMEFSTEQLRDAEKELAQADLPEVHLFTVEKGATEYPQTDLSSTGWRRCNAKTAAPFSAVGFLFAREIHQRRKVPIGVIESAWGGTSIESWTSLTAIGRDPAMMPLVEARGQRMEQQAEWELRRKRIDTEAAAARAKGQPEPSLPWRPDPPMWSLGQLYNAMIAPLTPFPIRGVLWYQGEQNTRRDGRPELYGRQLKTLIEDWRQRWAVGDFPFLFVQLANFRSNDTEDWATVREGQRSALEVRNTGMAVAIDVGDPDDVHPLNKQEVARRLALIARAEVYREPIESSGPLVHLVTREPGALRVWFDHVGEGLVVRGPALSGFEIAGADGNFHPAQARIDGESVVVHNDEVKEPKLVRYGWANDPRCELFNKNGLPASPFVEHLAVTH